MPLNLCKIEGDLLHHHSLARINLQVAKALHKAGYQVEVSQRNNSDQLDRWSLPDIDTYYDMLRDKGTPDVIFRHGFPPDFSKPQAGKVVYQQPWEFESFPRDWKFAWARTAEHIVCPSTYVQNMLIADGVPVKSTLIHHGINEEFLEEVEPLDIGLDPDKLSLLFVGGTIMRKGIDVLLDAVEAAFTEDDDVQLVIKDHPFYGSDISARIEQMKIPVIYLRNFFSPRQMVQLYAACDVFVLPSRGEGFGLPLIEAMAQGLTIVAPNHTGLADFATQKDMHIIPSKPVELDGSQLNNLQCVHTPMVHEPDKDALVDILRNVERPVDRLRYRSLLPTWEDSGAKYVKVFEGVANSSSAPIYMTDNLVGSRRVGLVPNLIQEGKIDEAIKLDSKDPNLWLTKARMVIQGGDLDGGLALVDEAMKLDSKAKVKYLLLRGRTQLDFFRSTNRRKYQINGIRDILDAAEQEPTIQVTQYLKDVKIPTAELQARYDKLLSDRKTISCVMICRNEEKHIERALSSIRPYVDEIVVVDTGSTDGTAAIVDKYADIHVQRPDFFDPEKKTLRSFSEARNHSISLATSDYIFWLDADDEVSAGAGMMIRKLASDGMGAASFPVHCPQANKDGGQSENRVRHYRFFQNLPSIRFSGDIHEQVAPSIIEAGLIPVAVDTPIHHHGYLDVTRLDEKYDRNLLILEQTDSGDDWSGFNLMTTWLLKGDAEKAIEFGEARLGQLNLKQAHAGKYLSTLTGAHASLKHFDRALEIIQMGIDCGTNLVEHYYNAGGIYITKAQEATGKEKDALLAEAESWFTKASEAPLFCRGGAVDIDTGGTKALLNIGQIRMLRGNIEGAREAFLQVLSKADDQFARQQLIACYKTLGDKWAADRHQFILSKQIDKHFSDLAQQAQIKMENGSVEEAVGIFKGITDQIPTEPGANLNYAISLMVSHKYEEAVRYLQRSIGFGPSSQAYYQLAKCFREQGKYEQAAVACDIALELEPGHGSFHFEMGMACAGMNLPRLALKSLQYGSLLGFNPPEALVAAGRCHIQLGNKPDGLEMIRRAQDINVKSLDKAADIYDALIH